MDRFPMQMVMTDQLGKFVPEYYEYPVQFAITAGAVTVSAVQSLQTQTDADFVIERMKYFFIDSAAATETVTAAAQEIPDITIQITDSASSKNLFFTPLPIHIVASNNAQFPNDLPKPRVIMAGAQLTFAIASTKTYALGYTLTFTLCGYKKLRIQ